MKRLVWVVVALAAAVVLVATTGCDAIAEKAVKSGIESATGVSVEENGDGVTVTGQDGSSITSSADGALPEGFPTDMPVYEPGTITSGVSSQSGAGKEFLLGVETDAAAPDVFDWYEARLKENGWALETTMKSDEGGLLAGAKGTTIFTLTVDSSDSGKTEITLSMGPKSQ